MTHTKDEALKLALAALECKDGWGSSARLQKERAITAIKQALAAQPATDNNESLESRAVQTVQEPVVVDWERIAKVQNAKLMAMIDEPGAFEKLCEIMGKYEALSPTPPAAPTVQESVAIADGTFNHNCPIGTPLYTTPSAQPAVPLTDEQINTLRQQYGVTSDGRGIKEFTYVVDFARAIEAKLKEKNNG